MNFDAYCHHCDTRYLLTTSSLRSMHNTSEGPIAYAVCPHGHHLIRRFHGGGDVRSATAMAG